MQQQGVVLDGVVIRRAGQVVIDGVSLALTQRRIGLIGRNGSGKTTLSRAICGLVAPDAGRVSVGGVEVAQDRRGALGAVGMIFQNPDHQIIFPTVEEEVAFGLRQMGRSRRDARAGARAALAAMGREDWAARPTGSLSQGQKHLVCLISVLAMAPATIVLDEPFTGLDHATTRRLRRVLDGLAAQLVHVSHDLTAFEGYDRILWIEAGRVAMDGPPEAVLPAYLAAMEAEDADTDLAG